MLGSRVLRAILKIRKGQRGQALVEFALMLPILMLLLLGSVDSGRAMYAVVTVNNAAFHSALWASLHLKQGTTGCGSGSSSTTICCPTSNNTAAADAVSPSTIREIVLRDFVAGLPYRDDCSSATSGISDACNPAVSCSTSLETAYTYGAGTQYRYVDVTVTYRFNAIGPYDALLGSIDIPRTVRIRKIP